jgi:DNA-binding transcriptional LysR family regulator
VIYEFAMDRLPLAVLPVDLAIRPWPVWIVTLKNRTVSPVVENFLDCVRKVAKPLAKTKKGASGA